MLTAATDRFAQYKNLLPGLMTCVLAAIAASFVAEHYGVPLMLMALLFGMSVNFLADDSKCQAGIQWCSREVLRFGVALLGLRLTLEQITGLGWQPVVLVICLVVMTISLSMLVARLMGFQSIFGLLTGGATAICGASAAMALAAALPGHAQKEKALLFTVIGVSTLSTVAMVLYPILCAALGYDEVMAGIFLGATIHDVAQVVGAGYGMSAQTGDTATVVKLLRVGMLLPVILVAALITRRRAAGQPAAARPPLLPWFAVGFLVLAGVNSLSVLPETVSHFGSELSRWCLLLAICALGMKTQLKELTTVGLKPVLLMIGETVFLVCLVAVLLALLY